MPQISCYKHYRPNEVCIYVLDVRCLCTSNPIKSSTPRASALYQQYIIWSRSQWMGPKSINTEISACVKRWLVIYWCGWYVTKGKQVVTISYLRNLCDKGLDPAEHLSTCYRDGSLHIHTVMFVLKVPIQECMSACVKVKHVLIHPS